MCVFWREKEKEACVFVEYEFTITRGRRTKEENRSSFDGNSKLIAYTSCFSSRKQLNFEVKPVLLRVAFKTSSFPINSSH